MLNLFAETHTFCGLHHYIHRKTVITSLIYRGHETKDIKKGHKMDIGTILPTLNSIDVGNKAYINRERHNDKIARVELTDYRLVMVGGEKRYYSNDTTYAVVNKSGIIRWFETRTDGDYSIK